MAKKGKIADPHAAREAARYDNPIPSRELILDLLTRAKKPLNHNKIAKKLGYELRGHRLELYGVPKKG